MRLDSFHVNDVAAKASQNVGGEKTRNAHLLSRLPSVRMSSAQAGRKKSKKKASKKKVTYEKKMPRAVVVRYPNAIITNWSGVMLDPAIRDHFTVRAALPTLPMI